MEKGKEKVRKHNFICLVLVSKEEEMMGIESNEKERKDNGKKTEGNQLSSIFPWTFLPFQFHFPFPFPFFSY